LTHSQENFWKPSFSRVFKLFIRGPIHGVNYDDALMPASIAELSPREVYEWIPDHPKYTLELVWVKALLLVVDHVTGFF
ncbi:MAG: hypothetical protein ACYTA5_24070, partial [Planctomycetota bacterium]